MKIYAAGIVCAALVLAGCEDKINSQEPWQSAPKEHKCTIEQMNQVEKETLFCDDNTSYLSSYCYATAIIRNCTKNERKEMQSLRK